MEKQSAGKVRMLMIRQAYAGYARTASELAKKRRRLCKLIDDFPEKNRALHNEELNKIKSKLQ